MIRIEFVYEYLYEVKICTMELYKSPFDKLRSKESRLFSQQVRSLLTTVEQTTVDSMEIILFLRRYFDIFCRQVLYKRIQSNGRISRFYPGFYSLFFKFEQCE